MGDLKTKLTPRVYGIAFGNAKKAKLIKVDKGQVFKAVESAKDETKACLQQLIDAGGQRSSSGQEHDQEFEET